MSAGCTDLQKYIKTSHKNFYAALDDDCAAGLLGARKAEYPRGAIVPSSEGFAVLKKLTTPEKRIDFLRAHCLVTGWTPDELKIAGRYLVTRNQKRLPVKSASGKKVELANGAVLELVHSSTKVPKTAVYKVASGVIEEGEPSERKDLGIVSKTSKGGAHGGAHYYGKERSYILSQVCEVASGKTATVPDMAGMREIIGLLAYAVNMDNSALCERIQSIMAYSPIIECFLIFGSREVVSNAELDGYLAFRLEFEPSETECVQAYQRVITKFSASLDVAKARRVLVQSICKGSGLSDPMKLISTISKAYNRLSSSNKIGDISAFSEGAAAMHKKYPTWKMWADDFRFRWWTVLSDIDPPSESSNAAFAEALSCMQMELVSKENKLLNPAMMGHIPFAATKMMLTSDLFMCMPLSRELLAKLPAAPLANATETLQFTSALSQGAANFGESTIRRGGAAINKEEAIAKFRSYTQ